MDFERQVSDEMHVAQGETRTWMEWGSLANTLPSGEDYLLLEHPATGSATRQTALQESLFVNAALKPQLTAAKHIGRASTQDSGNGTGVPWKHDKTHIYRTPFARKHELCACCVMRKFNLVEKKYVVFSI